MYMDIEEEAEEVMSCFTNKMQSGGFPLRNLSILAWFSISATSPRESNKPKEWRVTTKFISIYQRIVLFLPEEFNREEFLTGKQSTSFTRGVYEIKAINRGVLIQRHFGCCRSLQRTRAVLWVLFYLEGTEWPFLPEFVLRLQQADQREGWWDCSCPPQWDRSAKRSPDKSNKK